MLVRGAIYEGQTLIRCYYEGAISHSATKMIRGVQEIRYRDERSLQTEIFHRQKLLGLQLHPNYWGSI